MSQFCPFHVITIGGVAGFVECVREDCMAWMDGGCIRLTALLRPPVILHGQPDGNLRLPRGYAIPLAATMEDGE